MYHWEVGGLLMGSLLRMPWDLAAFQGHSKSTAKPFDTEMSSFEGVRGWGSTLQEYYYFQ